MVDKIIHEGLEAFKKLLEELLEGIASAAFHWLDIYMINPTDFGEYGFIGLMMEWIYRTSIGIGVMFFVYNMVKLIIQQMGGYNNRSWQEIVTKTVIGTLFASLAPFLLKDVLLKINNAWVEFIMSKGVKAGALADWVMIPGTANITLLLFALILAALFLALGIQYIIRLGELLIMLITAPLAAISVMNEDMNIWDVWWREACAVVFQQSFQITALWLVFNLILDGKEINDIILACGLMIMVLRGPTLLRKFLYSSGTGRMAVGAAGGVGKATMMRYASKKFIK